MKYMRLEDIKIKESFVNSIPTEYKVNECRQHWNETHEQDRYIVVNHDNWLVDGYIQYLVLKENDIDMVEVQISNKKKKKWARKNKQSKIQKSNKANYRECETTYIYGVHPNSKNPKERVWRVPNSWCNGWSDTLNVGDMLLVKTKYGLAPIEITKIERLSECPIDMPIKAVVRKLRKEEAIL